MLKQYFRDLPEPLFTTKLYDDFIQCVPKGADSANIDGISSIVAKMPLAHRETFQYVSSPSIFFAVPFLLFLFCVFAVETEPQTP